MDRPAILWTPPASPTALTRLLRELADLKRIESAAFTGSFASDRFAATLARLATVAEGGESLLRAAAGELAIEQTAAAIVATRAGGMSAETLRALGMDRADIQRCLSAAVDEHAGALADDFVIKMKATLGGGQTVPPPPPAVATLTRRLVAEPRAGATAVGKSRVLVVPAENHAEHCFVTAVTAAVLAGGFGADVGEVFFTAMIHHLHNAFLPDAGYGGEMMLGDHLQPVVAAARQKALDCLPPAMAQWAAAAAGSMTRLDSPAAACVNAADAVDRVLQTRFHQTMATFDAGAVCRELELVHEGPLRSFQNDMIAATGVMD